MADIINIYQRVNAVMEKVSYIQKEKKAGMQYSIVSHDSVTALLRPHLVEAGIVYYPCEITDTQDGNKTMVNMKVRFVNMDDPTDFLETVSIGHGIDSQDKGPGKAVSYAMKYALLKTFGLETGDDPDNDQQAVYKPAEKPTTSAVDRQEEKLAKKEFKIISIELKPDNKGEVFGDIFTDKGRVVIFKKDLDQLEEGGTYKASGIVKEGTFVVTGTLEDVSKPPF